VLHLAATGTTLSDVAEPPADAGQGR
jgi:hypothetical protein